MKKCLYVLSICVLAAAAACTKSTPSRPTELAAPTETTRSVTDASSGITVTSPQPVSPVVGQRYKFSDQPLTLTVKNAVSTGSSALTYGFQVASDANFATVVYAKDGVAEGAGQTSLRIDKLAGDKDYFWRARVTAGSIASPYSAGRAFNVGPEVVIQAPALLTPANGGQLNGVGSLVARNASHTGPAGPISYRFEVSDSTSFNNLVFVSTTPEQSGQTAVQVTARLTNNATYFWRAQASDPSNGITGPYSSVFSFKYVPFDMASATIVNSPPDLGSWPEGAKITSVEFTGGSFNVDFDRRDGPDRWPDMVPAGFSGPLQYTLGMCVNINDHWYCSGVVQFWHGRELEASAPPSLVGREWFYDPVRWGPMLGYQPSDGETVGLWVGAGNLRDGGNFTRNSCPRVCERSNVALVPWNNGGGASYIFSAFKATATGR
jgi:hypothetical protein